MRKIFQVQPTETQQSSSVRYQKKICKWHSCGFALSFDTCPDKIFLYDTQGSLEDEIQLDDGNVSISDISSAPATNEVIDLEWSYNGNLIAIFRRRGISNFLSLYDKRKKNVHTISIQSRQTASLLLWSPAGQPPKVEKSVCTFDILAIGMSKGGLLLYDTRANEISTIAGKHSDRITCGTWKSREKLFLCGDDCALSISNANGDTLQRIMIDYPPIGIVWSRWYANKSIAFVRYGSYSIHCYESGSNGFYTKIPISCNNEYGFIVGIQFLQSIEVCVIAYQNGDVRVYSLKSQSYTCSRLMFEKKCSLMSKEDNSDLIALLGMCQWLKTKQHFSLTIICLLSIMTRKR